MLQDFLAPELRAIAARLDAQSEQIKDVRADLKSFSEKMDMGFTKVERRFEDLRAGMRLSQRVEEIERTLRSTPKQ